jgi:hypothetical protein
MQCRVCLEQDDNEMISPCACDGSSKYIHTTCLLQWVDVSGQSVVCPSCRGSYTPPLDIPEPNRHAGTAGTAGTIRMLVKTSAFITFLIILSFCIALGFVYMSDTQETAHTFSDYFRINNLLLATTLGVLCNVMYMIIVLTALLSLVAKCIGYT